HLGLPLVEEYSRPRWILPARALATAVAVGLMQPASGGVLAALLAVAWIVSGLVIRFPVELAPRRALYLGGITNTGEPGRHWARRRWTDAPYSIPLDVLRLRWVAGTTRLEHDGGEALWLELELEARVEPRGDDVGQFFALLRYKGWTSYPEKLAEQLRSNVLDKLVERVGQSAVLDQARRQAVSVDPTTDDLLATGLQKMGWTLVELERCRVVVGPSAPVEPVRGDVVRLERVPDE
ncbi:MAG: hypothetical protein KC501_42505, partial [Myxococcales bacterium]|nr:hypothetical protein [Myxococcales bacterium]